MLRIVILVKEISFLQQQLHYYRNTWNFINANITFTIKKMDLLKKIVFIV